MVLGDFYVHVDLNQDPLGREFMRLLESAGYSQHVSGPTHNNGHTLNLVTTHGVGIQNLSIRDLAVSYHSAIVFELLIPTAIKPTAHCIKTRSPSSSATVKFMEALSTSAFIQSGSVDVLVDNYNTTLGNILDTLAPVKKKKRFSKDSPHGIMTQHVYLNKLECKWNNTKSLVFQLAWKDSLHCSRPDKLTILLYLLF